MNQIKSLFLALMLSFGFIDVAAAAIYVDNLPQETTAEELEAWFSHYGKVVKVERNHTVDAHAGIVHMGNFSMEREAIDALNGKNVNGKKIVVKKSQSHSSKYSALMQ